MKEYKREYPMFALCGLNCGLCPRHHTDGASCCPGCGGEDFHLKHPACAVITCNKRHDNVEYCFQCSAYPCERYANKSEMDSFITYSNVLVDFEKARTSGIDIYRAELDEKMEILEYLIGNWNDGKSKGFYCLGANLLKLDDLRSIMTEVKDTIDIQDIGFKEKVGMIKALFEKTAAIAGVVLKLRT